MLRRSGRKLTLIGLTGLLVITGLMPGGTPQAEALTVADRIETIDTSTAPWTPNAPGPSGIAYRPETNTLIVVDGDKNNELSTINLWEYDLDTQAVLYSASLEVGDGDDATGATWDSVNDILFVSTDGDPSGIYMFEPNSSDGPFGGADDGFIDVGTLITPLLTLPDTPDVEDPAYDASNGHLFVLNGNTSHVFELDPMAGGFGDGDDVVVGVGFVVPPDTVDPPDEHPDDWEGLALDPDTDNLLIGAKETDLDHSIYEVSKAGAFVDRIDVTVIENELGELPPLIISGLTVQPGSGGIPTTYWIADRGNHTPPQTNDGRLHRIHREQVVVPNQPPVLDLIGNKSGNEGTLITFDANAADSFGDNLTYSLQAGAPVGAAINATTGVFTWTPTEAQGRTAPHPVTVRVTDALGNFDNELIQITANEVNQLPIITDPGSLTRSEGQSINIGMIGSDSDIPANVLAWSATGLPSGVSIHPTSGVISGTVAAGASSGSPYNVTVTLTDNGLPIGTDQVIFPFIVEPATGPPDPDPDPDPGPTPDNPFVDDNGHIFENAIEWLAGRGITEGCNPPVNDRFCPNDAVTRGQMAVFLVRAFGYSDNGGGDLFIDDDGLFYENSADRLFTAGVTVGCNPPTNNRYCGENSVTRGQMAAFLVRAFDLPAYNGPDRFVDDNGNIFEGAIERLAQAGITLGCNPPTNNRFCPDDPVTRGQMAAFLKRAFGE